MNPLQTGNDRITRPQPKIEGPRTTGHSSWAPVARHKARQIEGATDRGLSVCNNSETLPAVGNAEDVEVPQYQWLLQKELRLASSEQASHRMTVGFR